DAPDSGFTLCLLVRRGGRAPGDSAMASGVDRQPSSPCLSGFALFHIQQLRERCLQRAGDSGYLDWLLGSRALPRKSSLCGPVIPGSGSGKITMDDGKETYSTSGPAPGTTSRNK